MILKDSVSALRGCPSLHCDYTKCSMNSSRDLMSTVQALSTGILQSVSVRQSLHMEKFVSRAPTMTIFEFQ